MTDDNGFSNYKRSRSRAENKRWTSVYRWAIGILVIILAMAVTALYFENKETEQALGNLSVVNKEQKQSVEDICKNRPNNPDCQRIEELPEPEDVTKSPDTSVLGPSSTDVYNAVQTYCSGGRCDADSPTQTEVYAAITEYCNNNQCRGPRGRKGEQGPAPTSEQLLEAVNTYCEENDCTGPQGEQGGIGPSGPPGPTGSAGPKGNVGRGIENVTCNDDDNFVVHFNNPSGKKTLGTTDCRVDEPAEDESDSPSADQTETNSPLLNGG